VVTGTDNPGRLGRAVMLAVALGKDPRNVGAAPGNDLVARLDGTRIDSDSDIGRFGAADATYDGVFRHGYALMAMRAASGPLDSTSFAWLYDQQCADGSWMPYRSDVRVPCAFNPALFVGPDTNSTAVAVEALAAYPDAAGSFTRGLSWLDAQQNADGGWGFYPGDPSDPNSTALVVQALAAAGKLTDAAFTDKSASPQAALLAFQLTCDRPAADRGALTYPGSSNAANSFATAQGVPALAGKSFPLTAQTLAAGVPAIPCEVPTTTTTTSSTTTVTTTTTAPTSTTTTVAPTAEPVAAPTASVLGVQAEQAASEQLANTGANSRGLAMAGVTLLLAGLGLSLIAARRR
jgi:LPXTG-motif cell wall-anchored protein